MLVLGAVVKNAKNYTGLSCKERKADLTGIFKNQLKKE
jgi:hypothetical protein